MALLGFLMAFALFCHFGRRHRTGEHSHGGGHGPHRDWADHWERKQVHHARKAERWTRRAERYAERERTGAEPRRD